MNVNISRILSVTDIPMDEKHIGIDYLVISVEDVSETNLRAHFNLNFFISYLLYYGIQLAIHIRNWIYSIFFSSHSLPSPFSLPSLIFSDISRNPIPDLV